MLQKDGFSSQGLENPESSPSEQESLSWPHMVQGRQGNGQEASCQGSSRGSRVQISSRVCLEARGLLKRPIQSVSLRPASPSWGLQRSFEKGLFHAGQPHSGLMERVPSFSQDFGKSFPSASFSMVLLNSGAAQKGLPGCLDELWPKRERDLPKVM